MLEAWVILSTEGERGWHAENAQHALEQHMNAFPDEKVLIVALRSEVDNWPS